MAKRLVRFSGRVQSDLSPDVLDRLAGELVEVSSNSTASGQWGRSPSRSASPGTPKISQPSQWGMANSSYKQVCRVWKAPGEERVGKVLSLFETSEGLSAQFLGRSFQR